MTLQAAVAQWVLTHLESTDPGLNLLIVTSNQMVARNYQDGIY